MKIMLTGGGTAGSATPLLAVVKKFREKFPQSEFIWIGTKHGPEKELILKENVKFLTIDCGKWRRYFSLQNIADIFFIFAGFFESLEIISREKPGVILSAGGFVSVPVVWAGWFLGVPSLIHQQDVIPGLANKLMSPVAKKITLALPQSAEKFKQKKTVVVGNPVREEILQGDRNRGVHFFGLKSDLPTLLILGGGTGALAVNHLVLEALPELIKFCQVIHLTGKGKRIQAGEFENYHAYEFLTGEMAEAYVVADLVVTRAGMGTLTELSRLGKPAVIIPIPDSHQEANAKVFSANGGAILLEQDGLGVSSFVSQIRELLQDKKGLESLSENIKKIIPTNAAEKISEEIIRII
ncbi:MAG: undecaprenyldiphospho-muramoylpentapeptide beta-N-acetylglucosaminyltransferase [Patescibacteria group bacterium]|nr:undecaprenyldiphospho-muramoylpentapeptide beta-N-acetylglucosaminyltransferase [Patescibacteria group bacterium]MDD5490701.1 undecaprenyldiphospho-muramoylpentapeptide beta-N-acetylglucosaminyltransferase [Patescibacteria group bacterium]